MLDCASSLAEQVYASGEVGVEDEGGIVFATVVLSFVRNKCCPATWALRRVQCRPVSHRRLQGRCRLRHHRLTSSCRSGHRRRRRRQCHRRRGRCLLSRPRCGRRHC